MTRPTVFTDHFFKISLPGLDVATFRECSGLSMEFDVFEWAEGGNNEFVHHLPGRVRYPILTFRAGLTQSDALQNWLWQTRITPQLKEVTVELQTADAKTTRSWVFADAFPVRWVGPELAAFGTGLAIEVLELAHSGLKVG
jgi:phage tail-like protein